VASKETQGKLLLTVAFAGAVTAWIAYRVSVETPHATTDAGTDSAEGVRVLDGAFEAEAAPSAVAVTPDAASTAADDAGKDGDSTNGSSQVDATALPNQAEVDAGVPDADASAASPKTVGAEAALLLRTDLSETERTDLLRSFAKPAAPKNGADAAAGVATLETLSFAKAVVGKLALPTGRLGVYACLVHPYDDEHAITVPAGAYPIRRVLDSHGDTHAVALELNANPWTTLKQMFVYDASGGTLCLTPREGGTELEARTGLEALIALVTPDGGERAFQLLAIPKSKLALATFKSAQATGPVYVAYDAKGQSAGVLIGLYQGL
jgi:hypothetical protein